MPLHSRHMQQVMFMGSVIRIFSSSIEMRVAKWPNNSTCPGLIEPLNYSYFVAFSVIKIPSFVNKTASQLVLIAFASQWATTSASIVPPWWFQQNWFPLVYRKTLPLSLSLSSPAFIRFPCFSTDFSLHTFFYCFINSAFYEWIFVFSLFKPKHIKVLLCVSHFPGPLRMPAERF